MENAIIEGEIAGGRAWDAGSKWSEERTGQGTVLEGKVEVAEHLWFKHDKEIAKGLNKL